MLQETENSENQVKKAENIPLNWKLKNPSETSSKNYNKLKIYKAKWRYLKKLEKTECLKSQIKKVQKVASKENSRKSSEKSSKTSITLKNQRTEWKKLH